MEKEKDTEIESYKKSAHKSEKKNIKLQSSVDKLEKEKRELESQLKVKREATEAEINLKQEVWYEVLTQGCSVQKAVLKTSEDSQGGVSYLTVAAGSALGQQFC